jgi:hypothetical protein
MNILYFLIISLVFLGVNVLIYYILYRIFKKHIKNILNKVNNIANQSITQQKTSITSHFDQELNKVKEIIRKTTKK